MKLTLACMTGILAVIGILILTLSQQLANL